MVMNKWRVIIVDDEPLAREGLKNCLLLRNPDFEVVGEAENIAQAWKLIQQDEQIDGLFLDIHIEAESERAGLDFGFALKNIANPPWIIFISGYEKYTLEAFKIKPVGYLLKPLEQSAVDNELDWIRKNKPSKNTLKNTSISRIEVKHKLRRKSDNNCIEKLILNRFLESDEILYIYSNTETATIEVYLVNDEILKEININLNGWLDKKIPYFLQTRKNIITNLKYVSGYRSDPAREGIYLLQFKEKNIELPIGSAYFFAFREAIKKGE